MPRKWISILVAIVLCPGLCTQFCKAQGIVIRGKVSDARSRQAINHASVQWVKSGSGTFTDSNGVFSLVVREGDSILSISSVGYQPQTRRVGTDVFIDILLSPVFTALEDVVVIGYGQVSRKDVTGAITTVGAAHFNEGMFAAPDMLFQGKVPGLQVISNNGQPGGNTDIRIRGNSALYGTGRPLFVIDGVPLDGRSMNINANPLAWINPADIASVDVLKDASATAIYGSRGAYGVVMITTKKGGSGRTKIEADVSVGLSSLLRRIEVLNAEEYREAIPFYGVSASADRGGDADALKAIMQTALQQQYTLGFSGGNENSQFRITGNLLNQEGIISNSGMKKYGVDAFTNISLLDSKKLGMDIHVLANQYDQDISAATDGAPDPIIPALTWNPTDSLFMADGSLRLYPGSVTNPIAMTRFVQQNFKATNLLASISPSYQVTPWLNYTLLLSMNYSTSVTRASLDQQILSVGNPIGRATVGNGEMQTGQITHTLNLHKKLGQDLDLRFLAGIETMRFSNKGFSATGYGQQGIGFGNFGLDYTNYIQYSGTTDRAISSYIDATSSLQSYFGRAMVNVKDRYYVTATLRADGSSKFGDNNKYGIFPSLAAAWNITQEEFFHVDAIDQLKLRASWGITGNQDFPAGSSQAKYSFRDGGTIIQVNNPNPNLKWQQDQQWNIGLDFSLLDHRIRGTVDYFHKKTTDLLFPSPPIQPSPPSSVVRWVNLDGTIHNSGLELSVSALAIDHPGFSWEISGNASFLHNKVEGMPSPISTGWLYGSGVSGTSVQVIDNGLPMQAFYTRKFLGIDKATGISTYADDGNTFYHVGNPNPSLLIGLSNQFRIGHLGITANWYGAFGQDVFYNTLLNVINVANMGVGQNIATSLFRSPEKESLANPVTASSRFIEKGNYLRLANLTVQYALGKKSWKSGRILVYLTGQNLLLLTKYPGFDPEANIDYSVNGIPSLGIDYAQYPSARTIIMGVKFNLQ